MKNMNKKRFLAGAMASVMLLGNVPAMASNLDSVLSSAYAISEDAQVVTMSSDVQAGTYEVPVVFQTSAEDASAPSSYAVDQIVSPASLVVDADGNISLIMDLVRRIGAGSSSSGSVSNNNTHFYMRESIQYKLAGSDTWLDVTVLEEEEFTITNSGATKDGDRPTKIELTGLTANDVSGVEFKYDDYKIKAAWSGSISQTLDKTYTGYLAIDLSSAKQEQLVTPSIRANVTAFTKSATITASHADSEDTLYYTVNGGAETLYEGPFTVAETATIQCVAKRTGYADSEPATLNVTKVDTSTPGYFGPSGVEFEEGEHAITLDAAKSSTSSGDSGYASLLILDAKLVVDANGNGVIQFETQHGTMSGMDCYLEKITYTDVSGSSVSVTVIETHEESYLYAPEKEPKLVEFPVTDTSASVFKMNAQAGTNSWYTNYHDFYLNVEEFKAVVEDVEPEVTPEATPEATPEVEDTGFLFGPSAVELTAGTYDVPMRVGKDYDHDDDSMTNDAVVGNKVVLEVSEAGDATFTVDFEPMEFTADFYGGVTMARYYTTDSTDSAYEVDAELVTEDTVAFTSTYRFTITNKGLDGLYVNFDVKNVKTMASIHEAIDAYMVFDFENAVLIGEAPEVSPEPTPEATLGFGSSEVELAAGTYDVPVALMKSTDITDPSMAEDTLGETAVLAISESGAATLTTEWGIMTMGEGTASVSGGVSELAYYNTNGTSGDKIDATINSRDEDGMVTSATLPVVNNAWDGIYVEFYISLGTTQDAYIAIDYTNAVLTGDAPEVPEVGGSLLPTVGTYTVEVSAKSAGKDTVSSFDYFISDDAVLVVDANGDATVSLTLGHGMMAGMNVYLENMAYYDLAGDLVLATVVEEHEEESYSYAPANPPKVVEVLIVDDSTYVVPMNAQAGSDGDYARYHDFDLWIDYATLEKVETEDDGTTGGGSTGGTTTPDSGRVDGTYSVPVFMKKYSGVKEYTYSDEASMANGALVGTAKAVLKGNQITYTVQFQGLEIASLYGHLTNLWHYSADDVADGKLDDPIPATITTTYEDSDLYGDLAKFPETVTFTYTGSIDDQIFVQTDVDAMIGYHYQNAVLLFNWTSAKLDGGASSGGASGTGSVTVTTPEAEEEVEEEAEEVETLTREEILESFADVSPDAWYADAVVHVVENGLFNGTDEGTFSPEMLMSRAMIMTVLHRFSGDETAEGGEHWYSASMDWAADLGITDGANPDSDVSREQLATILYRFMLLMTAEEVEVEETEVEEVEETEEVIEMTALVPATLIEDGEEVGGMMDMAELSEEMPVVDAPLLQFDDRSEVSDWALDAMTWANEMGIITGTETHTLAPQNSASRAEVATILMRFMAVMEAEEIAE